MDVEVLYVCSTEKEVTNMESATIYLKRQQASVDVLRAYNVFIDGKKMGTIHQMESRSFEVQPGHHEVFLTIDWCSSTSLSVDVVALDEVKLFCKANANLLTVFYFITVGSQHYISLFQEL